MVLAIVWVPPERGRGWAVAILVVYATWAIGLAGWTRRGGDAPVRWMWVALVVDALALMTLTHGKALPAMGLAASPEDQTFREHSSEAASHVLYGVVTEKVRSVVRKLL